jgi:hypothetical protein
MNLMRYYATLIAVFGLMCLCSCATRHSTLPSVSGEASFNADAGRGHYLRVKLHLESGKEFNCMVDTGSSATSLKKDLEPELGECLGIVVMKGAYGLETNSMYQAPKLYLGDTPLLTDKVIHTAGWAALGMDTLQHYCIQLDFTSHKIRFLNPNSLDTNDLGEAFPLTLADDNHVIVHAPFLGRSEWVLDTGSPFDFVLTAQVFEQASRGQQVVPIAVGANDKMPYSGACFSKAVLGGHTYTDLHIYHDSAGNVPNMIGLTFLARHLVTLNFPKRVMYLKQVMEGSPLPGALLTEEAKTFLMSVAEKGRLPGWSKAKGEIHWTTDSEDSETYPAARIFKFQTGGQVDAVLKDTYQYNVVRESRDGVWKLQRAWRSDAKGHVVEEYPAP